MLIANNKTESKDFKHILLSEETVSLQYINNILPIIIITISCLICTITSTKEQCTYPDTLPFTSLCFLWTSAQSVPDPQNHIPHRLRGWDDIEWSRNSLALLEVTHPQLGSSILPLCVCITLKMKWQFVAAEWIVTESQEDLRIWFGTMYWA